MRDQRGRSPSPRPLSEAVNALRESIGPETPLARIEAVWRDAVGDGIAAVAIPVSERDGVVTVECESAVWADELTLMERGIRDRLAAELPDQEAPKLRFRVG
ncbi:MAG: DUF721 domain-containing protein [Solirubrobacterales bacterium]|nr:DUF721 domain-containing protein [Solirubrobacterales bacterium]